MEFLNLEWVQWILGLVGVAFGLWVIPNAWWAKFISLFGQKIAPVMDKVAKGVYGAATIATGAGFENLGTILHKGAKTIDEAEDIPRLLAEYTEDAELTADEIKKLIEEVGEVAVAFKDVILVVKKK